MKLFVHSVMMASVALVWSACSEGAKTDGCSTGADCAATTIGSAATAEDSGSNGPRLEDRGPSVDDCDDYVAEEWAYDWFYEYGAYNMLCLGSGPDEPVALAESRRDSIVNLCQEQDISAVYPSCSAYQCVLLLMDEIDQLRASIDEIGEAAACEEVDPILGRCTSMYWDVIDYCSPGI